MHIRRGIKVLGESKKFELDKYMKYAEDYYFKYFSLNPSQVDKVNKTILLVTEEPEIIDQVIKKRAGTIRTN